ncbi:alpha/beta hydrolase-fold protein [Saccharomonospora sp. NPDC006951]
MHAADGNPARLPGFGRRAFLIAGATSGIGIGAATAVGLTGPPSTSTTALRRSAGTAYPTPLVGPGAARSERIYSHARGRYVNLVFVLPVNEPPRGLPMSLLLHGLHGSARTAGATGLLRRLSSEVTGKQVRPYGFVAVDGGDSYWHQHNPGDDPMAMLLEEIPVWLRERGLGGSDGRPFAVTGTSMGGFGALLYGRRRKERRQPVRAIGAISPALITSWREMRKRNAFDDQADWASMDPLRHITATAGIPTAVWCGTGDAFIPGVREFIKRAKPEIAYTAPGGHNDEFFRTAVPGLIGFLGKYAPLPDRSV